MLCHLAHFKQLEFLKISSEVQTAGWQCRSSYESEQDYHHSGTAPDDQLALRAGSEQSAAWLYAGLAFRMIIDLGLHIDAAPMPNARNITEEDLEIRRRVFWSAFVIDKIQSLYQGWSATLQASQCDVPIDFKDGYEELEYWTPFACTDCSSSAGSCSYSVSTFTQLCRWCVILNSTPNGPYKEKGLRTLLTL